MYILLKTNENSPSHNVMLIKVKSICDCIDHDKRSESRYPHPPQTHFLVCMQLTLGLSGELAPCPLLGAKVLIILNLNSNNFYFTGRNFSQEGKFH